MKNFSLLLLRLTSSKLKKWPTLGELKLLDGLWVYIYRGHLAKELNPSKRTLLGSLLEDGELLSRLDLKDINLKSINTYLETNDCALVFKQSNYLYYCLRKEFHLSKKEFYLLKDIS